MKVEELEKNSKVVNLVGEITSLEEKTEANGLTVQEGIFSDDTGQVKIVFWQDHAGTFKVGDKISMSRGWCKEFEGDLQVSTGKFGKITKVPDAPK